jgi:cobalamin biosynthesis protein CobT
MAATVRSVAASTSRILSITVRRCSGDPWLAFIRATDIPASASAANVSPESDAGLIVQTISAFRTVVYVSPVATSFRHRNLAMYWHTVGGYTNDRSCQ